MKYFDELIVSFATFVLRGVLAVGTGAVYVQYLALLILVSMVGTVLFSVFLVAAYSILGG